MAGDLGQAYNEIGRVKDRQVDFIEGHLKNIFQQANLRVNHSFNLRQLADNIYWRLLPRTQANSDPYLYMPQEQLLEEVLRLDLYACYLATKLELIYSSMSRAASWSPNNEHENFYLGLMQHIATLANVHPDLSHNLRFKTLPDRAALLQCFDDIHNQFIAKVDLRDNQGRTILSGLWQTAGYIFLHTFLAHKAVYPTLRQTLPNATMSEVDLRHTLVEALFDDFENIRDVAASFPINYIPAPALAQPSFLMNCYNHIKDFCFAPSRFEREIGLVAGLGVVGISSILGLSFSLYGVAFATVIASSLMLYRNVVGFNALTHINTRNLATKPQVEQDAFRQGQEAARTWTAYAKTFDVRASAPWSQYRPFAAGMQSELNEMESHRQRPH